MGASSAGLLWARWWRAWLALALRRLACACLGSLVARWGSLEARFGSPEACLGAWVARWGSPGSFYETTRKRNVSRILADKMRRLACVTMWLGFQNIRKASHWHSRVLNVGQKCTKCRQILRFTRGRERDSLPTPGRQLWILCLGLPSVKSFF